MTVRPSLTSAPKPIEIFSNREPWMNVPFVEPQSTIRTSSPTSWASRCLRDTVLSVSTRLHCGPEPNDTGSPVSRTASPRSGPLMTRKMPPGFWREYDGASSSSAVTLERSLVICPSFGMVASAPPGVNPRRADCRHSPAHVRSGHRDDHAATPATRRIARSPSTAAADGRRACALTRPRATDAAPARAGAVAGAGGDAACAAGSAGAAARAASPRRGGGAARAGRQRIAGSGMAGASTRGIARTPGALARDGARPGGGSAGLPAPAPGRAPRPESRSTSGNERRTPRGAAARDRSC